MPVDSGDDGSLAKNLRGGGAGLVNGNPEARQARQFPLQTPGVPLFQPLPSLSGFAPQRGLNQPNVAPILRQTLEQPGAAFAPPRQGAPVAALLGNPCITNEGK